MNTKEKVEIMQAWLDKKAVQFRTSKDDEWDELHFESEPLWRWDSFEYRIKKEPREWVVYVTDSNKLCHEQQRVSQMPIKVREVL